jgi:hypothetical protein
MGKASSEKKQRRLERSDAGRAVARVKARLARVERPGLFDSIDVLREGRDWPEWCLLPSEKLLPLVRPQLEELDEGQRDDLVQVVAEDAACELAALHAWQLAEGIYIVDPDLPVALSDTDLSEEIPADALQRLPEWCVYVTASGGFPRARGSSPGATGASVEGLRCYCFKIKGRPQATSRRGASR